MPPVIVSLTTIPQRNGMLHQTITSLRQQTRKPDEIRVYLTPHCEPIAGARCIVVDDKGPITKLSAVSDPDLPHDTIVVTVDDDQIYESRWLEVLLMKAAATADYAWGFAGWNVGGFLRDDVSTYEFQRGGVADVLEGFAGVAYRKCFFDEDVWNVPDACRYVDDVWISGYLRRRGIERRLVGPKMLRGASHGAKGIHTRPDFVELNRRAARMMFGGADFTVQKGELKLSILIPSLHQRAFLLNRLISALRAQPRIGEVEILVAADAGHESTGAKRNRLMHMARGRYIVHIDDDDLVAADYLELVLSAIDSNPGVDAIYVRGRRRSVDGHELVFDFDREAKVDGKIVNGVMWRKVGHLCPIRRELALQVAFPDQTIGEDVTWVNAITPLVRTGARAGTAGQVLYYYEYNPSKNYKRVR